MKQNSRDPRTPTEWHLFDPFRIMSGLSTHRRRKDMKQVQKVSCIDCPKLSRILIDRYNMSAHCLVSLDTNCKLICIEMQPIMNHNFQQAPNNWISFYNTDDVTSIELTFGLDQHIDRYLCVFLAYFLRMFCMSMDRVSYTSLLVNWNTCRKWFLVYRTMVHQHIYSNSNECHWMLQLCNIHKSWHI